MTGKVVRVPVLADLPDLPVLQYLPGRLYQPLRTREHFWTCPPSTAFP